MTSARLMSLWEDSPASLSASQESNAARQMIATSGRRCAALSRSTGPLGSWLRTFLALSDWDLTRYSLTWTPMATKRQRLYFRLQPRARRTFASVSSSWPTPQAVDSNGARNHTANRKNSRSEHHDGVTLNDALRMWPTVTADSVTSWTSRYAQGGMPLTTAVSAKQTPRHEGFDAGRHKGKTDSLHSQVKASGIPTPTSRDYRSGVSGDHGNHSPGLPEFLMGKLNPDWVEQLMGYPRGWTWVDDCANSAGQKDQERRKRPGKRPGRSRRASPSEPAA